MAEATKPIDPEIVRLQSLCFAHRITLKDALNRAGIADTTWGNWRKGGSPILSTLRRLETAINALISEQESHHGG